VPGTRAIDEPSVSLVTAANADAASRHTAEGADSYPDGPGAVRSDRSNGGSDTAAERT
jgi:hypothetical protein